MRGIAGIYYFGKEAAAQVPDAGHILSLMRHRGPDEQRHISAGRCTLYHSRLQIVDTTEASSQPFSDGTGRHLVYNGEVFNFKELGNNMPLKTTGDVEVLF